MTEAFSKNFIDYEEYPQSADIQNRCVNMIGDLFHAPHGGDSIGTSCIGSSEAIMLAVLAMKRRWKLRRQAEGKPTDRPNIIMSSAVQVCWEKAARYFEVEEKYVYCTETRYTIDPDEAVALIDENTIGIAAILGTTYTGHYEDVKGINDLLVEKGLDVPIHVDAASGGFVAPFVLPDLEWDFRLPQVVSINVSGHKVMPSSYYLSFNGVCSNPSDTAFISTASSTPASAGSSGARTSTSPRTSSSTSTTSAPSSPPSPSTSQRAPPRSSASTTSSSASAAAATSPS
jgi:glutamate decarboxylase